MGHPKTPIKWPIMHGFLILRHVWKSLNKTLLFISLDFSKIKNQTQNIPPKIFITIIANFRSAFAPSTGKICLGLFYTPLLSRSIKFYKKKKSDQSVKNSWRGGDY